MWMHGRLRGRAGLGPRAGGRKTRASVSQNGARTYGGEAAAEQLVDGRGGASFASSDDVDENASIDDEPLRLTNTSPAGGRTLGARPRRASGSSWTTPAAVEEK